MQSRTKEKILLPVGTELILGLPWCGGAFLQGRGGVGSIGEGVLGGHYQWEGDTCLTGALAVGVWHRHRIDTTTWNRWQKPFYVNTGLYLSEVFIFSPKGVPVELIWYKNGQDTSFVRCYTCTTKKPLKDSNKTGTNGMLTKSFYVDLILISWIYLC